MDAMNHPSFSERLMTHYMIPNKAMLTQTDSINDVYLLCIIVHFIWGFSAGIIMVQHLHSVLVYQCACNIVQQNIYKAL